MPDGRATGAALRRFAEAAKSPSVRRIARIVPRRRFGQNFLHEKNLINKLLAASGIATGDLVHDTMRDVDLAFGNLA